MNAIASRLRATMNATGIGYAGINGVWWLPAVAPYALPLSSKTQLDDIAQAIFALFDTVNRLYDTPEGNTCGLTQLLQHKVPARLLRYASRAPVLSVRPDFQLLHNQTESVSKIDSISTDAVYRFVATELEICPSAQGYAHAMQVGYGIQPDLLHALLALLAGRELIFVSTQQWSEFIWEQLAFCKALTEAGGRAQVWLDVPIQTLATQLQRGERWVPPMFGVSDKPDNWDDNMLRRIRTHGLDSFLIQDLPEDHTDVVAFRFGYLDCFAPELLDRLQKWEHGGATFLNPTSFLWDSKVVMAALRLPLVREQLNRPPRSPKTSEVLDMCIPETHLLTPNTFQHIVNTRAEWVLKFAGFDSGQQAWGGRSLQVGARHTDTSWHDILQRYLDLPFPVVAQRSAPSAILNIDYFDEQDQVQRLLNGRTRLRSFMLRGAGALGSHLTVVGGVGGVSEGTGAVQMPIHFAK